MRAKKLSRREFLRLSALTAASVVIASCTKDVEEPVEPVEPDVPEEAEPQEPIETSAYKEAPALAEKVEAGELPAVDERLPSAPMVIDLPWSSVGTYGGTLRKVTNQPEFSAEQVFMYTASPLHWLNGGTAVGPGLAESWESNADATEWTFYFREGVKWSDGEPFTIDDILFWWEDMVQNEECSESIPAWALVGGEKMTVDKVNDFTVTFKFAAPAPLTDFELATGPKFGFTACLLPSHYMKQFHPDYSDFADFETFEEKQDWWTNPDQPVLLAWKPAQFEAGQRMVMERNPYFWCVDKAGNQLPYIDTVDITYGEDLEVLKLKVINGQVDFLTHPFFALRDLSLFKESEAAGDYRVELWESGAGGAPAWTINWNQPDPEKQEVVRMPEFRQALSHAMDREQIRKLQYFGLGGPASTGTVSPNTSSFNRTQAGKDIFKEWRESYVAFDLEKAKSLLDSIDVVDQNGDGWRNLPSGAELEIILYNNSQDFAEVGELVKEQWQAAGINSVHTMVSGQQIGTDWRNGNSDVRIWGGGAPDGPDILSYPAWIVSHGANGRWAALYGSWMALEGTPNEGVDADKDPRDRQPPWEEPPVDDPNYRLFQLYKEAIAEPDIDKREALLFEMIRIHIDEGPFLLGIIADLPHIVIVGNKVMNVPTAEEIPLGGWLGPWVLAQPGSATYPEQYYLEGKGPRSTQSQVQGRGLAPPLRTQGAVGPMGKPSMVDSETYRVSAHLPDALLVWGTVDAVGGQILTAGARETLTVAIRLTKPLSAGYRIEVWNHFVSDMGRPQRTDPEGAGHFSCDTPIPATPIVYPDAKVHGPGSFFPYRRYAGIHLDEAAPAGAPFTFRISNVSMQTYEETLFNLRIAILDGDRLVGYLGDADYVVKGAAAAQLVVVAPTCVEVGEPFDIKIVTRDRFGNKTGDPLDALAFDVVVNEGPGTLTFDEISFDAKWLVHVVRGVTLDAEGPHYVGVRAQGERAICGVSNPIAVRDSWPERVVWGDMHQHTYFADGRGTPAANIEYAISTSCLDFVTIAAHQERTYNPPLVWMAGAPPQTGWEAMQTAAEAYNGAEIVAILGSEAGVLGPVAGHMNSYFLDVDNRPEFERMGLFFQSDADIDVREHDPETFYARYLAELERSKGEFLLLPHAHACGGPGKFELPERPEYQTNVEIVSVHGVFEAFYHQWLSHGHFVGVHGGGDNHMTSTGNGNPGWHYPNTNGLAAAVVESRTRKGIFDAFRGRKTYAVTGNQRIHLEFSINDAEMGDIVACEETHNRRIACHVAGTAPVMKVELFRNKVVIATATPELTTRDTLRLSWTDSWGSRRVDNSETTGTIALESGALDVVGRLHAYHRTDRIAPVGDGTLRYRTNGYSGITRGAILAVTADDADPDLRFAIHDVHLDTVLLDETLVMPLAERRTVMTRPLGEKVPRSCFTRDPVRPVFRLEADWIDMAWPKVVDVAWTDAAGDAFYYVRVEQIDGNIAWSSPIWFVAKAPA